MSPSYPCRFKLTTIHKTKHVDMSQGGGGLLSPGNGGATARRRSSVMFSDVVLLHEETPPPTRNNVCSSEKMTQAGDGHVHAWRGGGGGSRGLSAVSACV
jgi:hypothetical protein